MKKYFIYALITIVLCAGIFSSPVLAEVTISIGASLWYSDWKPAWEDGKSFMQPHFIGNPETPLSIPIEINDFDTHWAPMYGPVLSIGFLGKWNISTVFMYGKYFSKSEGYFFMGSFFITDSKYTREIDKYDSDTTLSYSIHKYVKAFVGFKYQAYAYKEDLYYLTIGGPYMAEGDSRFEQYGPGIGLGLTLPLYKGLYLLYNLSASYFFGFAKYDMAYEMFYDIGTTSFSANNYSTFDKERLGSIAGNTSLSFAYYIEPANMTLALGFRYQILKFFHSTKRKGFLKYSGKHEHFYGGTFTTTYSFNISGKKDK